MAFRADEIPKAFIQHATTILGNTSLGLSGAQIVRITAAYAVDYDVDLPHPSPPLQDISKKDALYQNLLRFLPSQQYVIIKELCDHPDVKHPDKTQLKLRLISRYRHLDPRDAPSEVNETLVAETQHWLGEFPEVLRLYSEALEKYDHGTYNRNLLDDLRLALEMLVRALLKNGKTLENQLPLLGDFFKAHGGSVEMANTFRTLLDYYTKYQNNHVKHHDAAVELEIELVVEQTSSFMKYLVRLSHVTP